MGKGCSWGWPGLWAGGGCWVLPMGATATQAVVRAPALGERCRAPQNGDEGLWHPLMPTLRETGVTGTQCLAMLGTCVWLWEVLGLPHSLPRCSIHSRDEYLII